VAQSNIVGFSQQFNAVCSAHVLLLLWHIEFQIAKSMEDFDEHDEELLELLLLAARNEITI
jgi:hypothetical protein